mmetsp:Transcript_29016/g.33527  ORF Transcript_29016/g.33527 Transcript_29016/m.33527 type:complete len:144 (+) Transcript_29016:31-462(+)
MLAKTLRRAGDHGSHVPAISKLDRVASYMAGAQITVHPHEEPNFRKRPVGWAGWNSPKYTDPFAPFVQQTPVRHVDRGAFFGMWFGMGHFALKNFFGPLHWKFWLRVAFCGVAGWGAALALYSLRMWKNGWQWKNRGAVYGLD